MPYDIIKLSFDEVLTINGRIINDEYPRHRCLEWVGTVFYNQNICPFCKHNLNLASKDDYDEDLNYIIAEAYVGECYFCGYWQAYYYEDVSGEGPMGTQKERIEAHVSKLYEYPESIPIECKRELAQYLKVNPAYWNLIEPRKLEILISDIFKANYKNCDVVHVGAPNDGGFDVVFIDSGEKRWLIQVKRRENHEKSEGVSTLRNLLGAMVLENSKYGIVVSTSDQFSYWANLAQRNAKKLGYVVELIDRGKLARMIEPMLPDPEWIRFLKNQKPEWLNELGVKIPNRRQITIEKFIQHLNAPPILGG